MTAYLEMCIAPVPTETWVTVVGRPFEFWELVQPLDVTETGRRHHKRPRVLGFSEAEIADLLEEPGGWPKWLRIHGEPDRGPYRAALMRQLFGPQPHYVARVGLDRVPAIPDPPSSEAPVRNTEWLHLAACRDSADEFVDVSEGQAHALIEQFCQRCPTQVPCGELGAEQSNRVGSVWGGRFVHNKRSP